MTPADEILAALDDLDISHLIYVPCSTARPVLEPLTARLGARAIVATVESEAAAIGTGLALAGRRPLLMMQDTGLGNALTVLTTLPKAYHVPLLILATRTGGLREINAVVHEYSDGVPAMLDACRIPRLDLDYRVPLAAWRGIIAEAGRASRLSRRPTVLLADLKAGHPEADSSPARRAAGPGDPSTQLVPRSAQDDMGEALVPRGVHPERGERAHDDMVAAGRRPIAGAWEDHAADVDGLRLTRLRARGLGGEGVPAGGEGLPLPNVEGHPAGDEVPALAHLDALSIIAEAFADDPLVSSCGVASRELASLGVRDSHLYLLNSMGAVGAVGLGLALGLGGRRVAAIEGDGGFLMGLGAVATIATVKPAGLVWVVVDNGVHCSTGGQPTAAALLDLGALAEAAGLPVLRAAEPIRLRAALVHARTLTANGPVVVHVRTSSEAAPTPYFQPDAAVLADRFQRALGRSDEPRRS